MTKISRRGLIKTGVSTAVGIGVAGAGYQYLGLNLFALGPTDVYAVGEGQPQSLALDKGPESSYAHSLPKVLEGVRIYSRGKQQEYWTGFGAHGLVAAPFTNKIFAFEKWGVGAAIIDPQTSEVSPLAPAPDHVFYGHGTLSLDGRAILATETNVHSGLSSITVRDAKDGRILDTWRFEGRGLHDLGASQTAGVYLAPFSGRQMRWKPVQHAAAIELLSLGDSYLDVLDAKTGKTLERMPAPDEYTSLTHISMDPVDDRRFYIGTVPRKIESFHHNGNQATEETNNFLKPTYGEVGKSIQFAHVPPEIPPLRMEILNMAVLPDKDMVCFVASMSHYLLFYRRSDLSFLAAEPMPGAGGLVLRADKKGFYHSHLGGRITKSVDWGSSGKVELASSPLELGRGSHLYHFNLKVRDKKTV